MGGIIEEIRIALHAIWTRRWLGLAVAWAVCIAGWLVVSQMPSKYESHARVFVQLNNVLPAGVDPSQASDAARDVDTVRQTLTSAVSLEKVVRGTDLAQTVSSDRDVADRVGGLQNAIKIVAQQDNLFEITTTAATPRLATQITQKLIDLFVETNLSEDRNQSSQAITFLDGQLDALGRKLQDAEGKRADFQNRYLGALPGTGSIADRIGAARTQMSQVDGDLAAAQSSLAAISGQMAGTQRSVPGGGGIAPGVGPARARLALVQGQLADARARGFTDSHPDVVALKPKVLHLMAGTNDIAGNTGPMTIAQTQDNLLAMAQLARANHIRVLLASVPPAANFPWRPGLETVAPIRAINNWLARTAPALGATFVDYTPVLATPEGGMKPGLAYDGVHPTAAGYDAMAGVLEPVLKRLGV